jgi:hypothetical protein
MSSSKLSALSTRKATLAHWRGASHPETIAADRALRVARLAIALRANGLDILAEAVQEAADDDAREWEEIQRRADADIAADPEAYAQAHAQAVAGNVLPMVRP